MLLNGFVSLLLISTGYCRSINRRIYKGIQKRDVDISDTPAIQTYCDDTIDAINHPTTDDPATLESLIISAALCPIIPHTSTLITQASQKQFPTDNGRYLPLPPNYYFHNPSLRDWYTLAPKNCLKYLHPSSFPIACSRLGFIVNGKMDHISYDDQMERKHCFRYFPVIASLWWCENKMGYVYETGKKWKFFKPMAGLSSEPRQFDVDVMDCAPEKVLCGKDVQNGNYQLVNHGKLAPSFQNMKADGSYQCIIGQYSDGTFGWRWTLEETCHVCKHQNLADLDSGVVCLYNNT